MAYPEFRHIHCSSRFDRSAESLDADLSNWQQESSLVTLTEITDNNRRQVLDGKGWGYYCAVKSAGQDNCAVCWDKSVWAEQSHSITKLTGAFRSTHHPLPGIYACNVNLKHKNSGHKLLVSVAHLPSDVQGYGNKHWATQDAFWKDRKQAYQQSMRAWSTHVNDRIAKARPDAALVCGDFNINWKLNWFRDYMDAHWGKAWNFAWRAFPTEGGSLHGGPVAPLGAPGKGGGDRIIDGTLFRGLKVTLEPNLMARVSSSDHRPYREAFRFNNAAGHGITDTAKGQSSGDTKHSDEWWGFGDYMDDEIYDIVRVSD